ncbi:MAG: NAD-dependent epimerase/dehydratase family protein [Deltaproteobacteria bacterium]|nr:NAD-dependent epimerase/dehydratase family protein [Deltaproteobacteria bacterium]
MKRRNLPKILVTGASGIIGRNIIKDLCEYCRIYALARRTQQDAGVLAHKNIKWIQVDIACESSLAKVVKNIKKEGGVDFVIHLAAYYDFGNVPHPEYERTNVTGTRLMLEHSKELGIKRFIYSSSIAACNFPAAGESVNERTSLDADFPYARVKKECEQMLKKYSENFPCSSLRLAAVYTDWCEFGPLYMLLKTWLSSSLRSRILGGKGEAAIPYVHVNCVSRAISIVLDKTDRLPRFDIYVISPDSSTSHQELYDLATRLYCGEIKHPIFIPKWLAKICVYICDLLGRFIGKRPFVRPWMMQYIDLQLNTESDYTRKTLGWEIPQRMNILHRLLLLIDNLKNSPLQWHQMNKAALEKTRLERPNLILAELMQSMQKEITDRSLQNLISPGYTNNPKHYYDLQSPNKVKWYIELVYNLLIASVRNSDRYPLVNYARSLANIKSQEGFDAAEVCLMLNVIANNIRSALLARPETKGMELLIHDWISLAIQLAIDEVENSFERVFPLKTAERGKRVLEICNQGYKDSTTAFCYMI